MMKPDKPALLCVANYRANTGYAWNFIEGLYARVADHLAAHGIRTFVAYPAISSSPRALNGSAAQAVVLDASLDGPSSIRAVQEFIRRESVRVVYFTDHPVRHSAYLLMRRAGAQRILVHDHASGERLRPRALKWVAKWLLARLPGVNADVVITVSDYVARRQVEVGIVPARRVYRVWNGLRVPPRTPADAGSAHDLFGVEVNRPLVGCACRATPEKCVAYLFRAFDRLVGNGGVGNLSPVLVYIGDGPCLAELRDLRDTLSSKDDIIIAGYRPDAAAVLANADVCVVPSVWQDAFPLAVLETMAAGRPIVATSVGGIPEMIEHDVTGLLVPPADEETLAAAIGALLRDRARAGRLGDAARRRVAERFTPERQISELTALIEAGFGGPCDALRRAQPVPWSLQGA
jgi:glycosyltransferase involved in cell wall biosynthesis